MHSRYRRDTDYRILGKSAYIPAELQTDKYISKDAADAATCITLFIYLVLTCVRARARAQASSASTGRVCIGQSRKYFMQIFAYAPAENKNPLSNLSRRARPYRVGEKFSGEIARGFPSRRDGARVSRNSGGNTR